MHWHKIGELFDFKGGEGRWHYSPIHSFFPLKWKSSLFKGQIIHIYNGKSDKISCLITKKTNSSLHFGIIFKADWLDVFERLQFTMRQIEVLTIFFVEFYMNEQTKISRTTRQEFFFVWCRWHSTFLSRFYGKLKVRLLFTMQQLEVHVNKQTDKNVRTDRQDNFVWCRWNSPLLFSLSKSFIYSSAFTNFKISTTFVMYTHNTVKAD